MVCVIVFGWWRQSYSPHEHGGTKKHSILQNDFVLEMMLDKKRWRYMADPSLIEPPSLR